jgi:hypothetical protein
LGHATNLLDDFHFGGHLNPSDAHLFLHLQSTHVNDFLNDFGFGLLLRYNDGHSFLICDETYLKMVNVVNFVTTLPLGSQPKQGLEKVWVKNEAQESCILPSQCLGIHPMHFFLDTVGIAPMLLFTTKIFANKVFIYISK